MSFVRPKTGRKTPERPASRGTGAHRVAGRAACLLIAGGALIAAAGCSSSVKGGDNADLIAGKRAFVAKCGSCHTLARAGTKGTVGPNLDRALEASVAEGLVPGRGGIRGIVEQQIRIPNPEGAMPANLVKGSLARDVAEYVAKVAAAPGKDSGLLATAVEAPGAGKPAVEKGGKLSIAASPSGQLAFVTNKASGTAGAATLEMPNTSGVSHNIALEAGEHGASGSGAVLGASAFTTKGTASVKVTLKPGTYTFFCQAPGHRAAGMFGTLVVK